MKEDLFYFNFCFCGACGFRYVAFAHVNLIPMHRERIRANQTVVICVRLSSWRFTLVCVVVNVEFAVVCRRS